MSGDLRTRVEAMWPIRAADELNDHDADLWRRGWKACRDAVLYSLDADPDTPTADAVCVCDPSWTCLGISPEAAVDGVGVEGCAACYALPPDRNCLAFDGLASRGTPTADAAAGADLHERMGDAVLNALCDSPVWENRHVGDLEVHIADGIADRLLPLALEEAAKARRDALHEAADDLFASSLASPPEDWIATIAKWLRDRAASPQPARDQDETRQG